MNKRFVSCVAIILASVMLLTGCSSSKKIRSLCDAIEKGDNAEAIRIAEGIRDLNAESDMFPRLTELLEGPVTTPLLRACETGNGEMIIWLLEHGAKTDYAPGRNLYPLEGFCDTGAGINRDALQKLLDCGADPEQYKRRPPLFRLAQTLYHRHDETYPVGVEMVVTVLDSGAKWQDPTDGYTILHYGATQRDGSLLRVLLERKEAEEFMNVENKQGQTPLDVAIQNGCAECEQLLRAAGAGTGAQ